MYLEYQIFQLDLYVYRALLAVGIGLLDGDRNSDADLRRRERLPVDIPLENPAESPLSEHRVRPEVPGGAPQLRQREHLQVRRHNLPARRNRPSAASLIHRRRSAAAVAVG
ncbi:PAP/OAS1 substrate-binding domain superfamily [Striga asiatica]|uniref:PAP/OAS1 substrate-binding domain superfamily n=1 Tax=Striga asiatica TaxID=4170 RepID=A0A5A7QZ68_STRAF|nr:PAP/OAS1 substrate-binding domain superfamily [Striga asiatica]